MAKRNTPATWEEKEQQVEYKPTKGAARETRGKGDRALFARHDAIFYGYSVIKYYEDDRAPEQVETKLTGTSAVDRACALNREAGFPDEYYFKAEYTGPKI